MKDKNIILLLFLSAITIITTATCSLELPKKHPVKQEKSQDDAVVASETFYKKGNKHRNEGKYKEAIIFYTKAIELNPDHANAYHNRGISHAELGKYKEAIEDYTKAIELNPNNVASYFSRANTFLDNEEYEKSIADFDKVIKRKHMVHAENVIAYTYMRRAFAKHALGKFADAKSDRLQAIKLNKDLERRRENHIVKLGIVMNSQSIEGLIEMRRKVQKLAKEAGENQKQVNYFKSELPPHVKRLKEEPQLKIMIKSILNIIRRYGIKTIYPALNADSVEKYVKKISKTELEKNTSSQQLIKDITKAADKAKKSAYLALQEVISAIKIVRDAGIEVDALTKEEISLHNAFLQIKDAPEDITDDEF